MKKKLKIKEWDKDWNSKEKSSKGIRERKESLRNIHPKLEYFFNFKGKISSIKKENELIHFYRFSSIVRRENIQRERENSENIQSIIYLTFLGRRFREGLGILSFVEFDPLNELLVTYHSWIELSSHLKGDVHIRQGLSKKWRNRKKDNAFYWGVYLNYYYY